MALMAVRAIESRERHMTKAGEKLIAAAKEARELSDRGFARRVDTELDALGYPKSHELRIAARTRCGLPGILEEE